MKRFWLLAFLLTTQLSHAAEEWAYCDGQGRAYLKLQTTRWQCPPQRTFGPHAQMRKPMDKELCTSIPAKIVQYRSNLDYICALPVAAETGEAVVPNTNRCLNADAKNCQVGEGGLEGPGVHNVPSQAWYSIAGARLEFPAIRCQCGCFAGETHLTTPTGTEAIQSLADKARTMAVQVMQGLSSSAIVPSRPLRGDAFTVGGERKPLLQLSTDEGTQLTLTELHPILVDREERRTFIQARELVAGDRLVGEDGQSLTLMHMSRIAPVSPLPLVYNLDTRAATPAGHVISAAHIKVGDLYWQKRLSEQDARRENLFSSANSAKQ